MCTSPALELNIGCEVTPTVVHKAAFLHWQWVENVKQGLDKDVWLVVLKKVSPNTPTTWCARMLVVAKKTGKPRRVIELCGLNKSMARQTHSIESPFMQASGVPAGTWKTTVDAWE